MVNQLIIRPEHPAIRFEPNQPVFGASKSEMRITGSNHKIHEPRAESIHVGLSPPVSAEV